MLWRSQHAASLTQLTKHKTITQEKIMAKAPKAPKAPKAQREESNGVTRPAAGTKTGAVWAIADSITKKTGNWAIRSAVLEQCEAEGINPATGATQYNLWRTFNGITGRLTAPKPKAPKAPAAAKKTAKKATKKTARKKAAPKVPAAPTA